MLPHSKTDTLMANLASKRLAMKGEAAGDPVGDGGVMGGGAAVLLVASCGDLEAFGFLME